MSDDEKLYALQGFFFTAKTRKHTHGERYGQALFNHLAAVRPDLSEKIRGVSDKDPFYCEGNKDSRIDAFVKFIEENW